MIVLYHPGQYPLARALCARYGRAELWYLRGDPAAVVASLSYSREELLELDQLASERTTGPHLLSTEAISAEADPDDVNEPLRVRLRELEIISPRPFVPWARVQAH